MKKKFLKICSVFLVLACILSQNAFAFQSASVTVAKSNSDFAIKSAKIIKKYDSPTSKSAPDSTPEMLRIIGRAADLSFDFKGFGAAACIVGTDGRFLLQFENNSTLKKCLDTLKNSPDILYAEQDAVVYTSAAEASENASLSWGTAQIGADKYSQYLNGTAAENGVTVAFIDSGAASIDFLRDKLVSGYDFINGSAGGATDTSSDSHGTFLASIVADCTKGANVNIMPVRVVESKTGTLANAVNGIYYAVDNGADVVNISLCGRLSDCRSLDDALTYAYQQNVTVVVCAGNVKSNTDSYCPAHNESTITVSAVDESLNFASDFSNYGAAVDMCAPGVNIIGYSASGALKTMSGTSMSAAFVSAGAAMFKLQHPECTASQVQAAVKKACTDLGDTGVDVYCGYGIPDFSNFITDKTVYAQGIGFDEKDVIITVGESKAVTPIFTPSDTTDKSVEWTSSNPDAVYVDSTGTVTAKKAGTAVIMVKTADGGFEAAVNIIAVEPETPPFITSISVKNPPDKTDYTYKSGESLDLSGIELEAVYSDGTKQTVTDTSKITARNFSTAAVGEHSVELEYAGCTAQLDITVSFAWWQWIIRILLLGFLWY